MHPYYSILNVMSISSIQVEESKNITSIIIYPYVPVCSPPGDPRPEEDPIDDIAVGTKNGPTISGFVVYWNVYVLILICNQFI